MSTKNIVSSLCPMLGGCYLLLLVSLRTLYYGQVLCNLRGKGTRIPADSQLQTASIDKATSIKLLMNEKLQLPMPVGCQECG